MIYMQINLYLYTTLRSPYLNYTNVHTYTPYISIPAHLYTHLHTYTAYAGDKPLNVFKKLL